MSTETLGEKLRQLREKNELPLRKAAALIDIDVAIPNIYIIFILIIFIFNSLSKRQNY